MGVRMLLELFDEPPLLLDLLFDDDPLDFEDPLTRSRPRVIPFKVACSEGNEICAPQSVSFGSSLLFRFLLLAESKL